MPGQTLDKFSTHLIDAEPPGVIKGHFHGLDYTTSITDCIGLLGLHNKISQGDLNKRN